MVPFARDAMSPSPPSLEARLHPQPYSGRGTGTRLWLVRHAEVHADWQGVAYGMLDVPLSAEGEARTQELAEAFGAAEVERLLCSPLSRARALGTALAERLGVACELRPKLAEIHRGSWEGRRVDELYRDRPDEVRDFYADPWSWCGHGGECDGAVRARVVPLIDQALAEGGGGTLVAVTHYNVMRVFAAAALGMPPERSFALRIDPGRALLLLDAVGGWQLFHSNVRGPAADGTAAR